jgi:ACS family sodium-dependent inorganic phosphate cotransporter
VVGVIWFIAWWLLVYDSPAQHPHISEKEKTYILKKLGETVNKKRVSVFGLFLCTFFSSFTLVGQR